MKHINFDSIPSVFVFDQDADIQACWRALCQEEGITDVHQFANWEEFLAKGNLDHVRGAIALVDDRYDHASSQHSGVEIARGLRALGAKRVYSTSSNPHRFRSEWSLFDDLLEQKLPKELTRLLRR